MNFLLTVSNSISSTNAGFATNEVIIYSIVIVLLLICSALISSSEVAYFSMGPAEKEELRNDESKNASLAMKLLEKPQELLATILISNNFVNVGIVILSSALLSIVYPSTADNGTIRFILEVFLITFIVLLIGEVIPKVYATKNGMTIALFMARPLNLILNLPPLSWLKNFLVSGTNLINKYAKKRGVNISTDELEQAIILTRETNSSEEEQKILEGIIRFGNTDVKQIMRSRMEVVALEKETGFHEVLERIIDAGYSRIPVYDNLFDDVIGILYIKDLLEHLNEADDFNWLSLIRKPFFVPENKKIDDLLKEFQGKKMHMAVVVDEYGGASGIITLEDVLEEIVGDITDEFDEDEIIYKRIDDNTFVFEGRTALVDVYKVLDIDGKEFEQSKGESDSIGGFIVEQAGRILKNKEFIRFENYKLIVETSDKRRIKTVKIIIENHEA